MEGKERKKKEGRNLPKAAASHMGNLGSLSLWRQPWPQSQCQGQHSLSDLSGHSLPTARNLWEFRKKKPIRNPYRCLLFQFSILGCTATLLPCPESGFCPPQLNRWPLFILGQGEKLPDYSCAGHSELPTTRALSFCVFPFYLKI